MAKVASRPASPKRTRSPSQSTRPSFRVTGIGGVFLRGRNHRRLLQWYERHLGLKLEEFGGVIFAGDRNPRGRTAGATVWAVFPHNTDYFGNRRQVVMVNYRVENLEGLLVRLRRSRVRIDPHQETAETGQFAWAYDPEGNRFELWEPREPPSKKRSKKAR